MEEKELSVSVEYSYSFNDNGMKEYNLHISANEPICKEYKTITYSEDIENDLKELIDVNGREKDFYITLLKEDVIHTKEILTMIQTILKEKIYIRDIQRKYYHNKIEPLEI